MSRRAASKPAGRVRPVRLSFEPLEPRLVLNGLAISELNYNPHAPTALETGAGFTDAQAFEFIELRNTSETTIDLQGVRFTEGITFDFSTGSVDSLLPGQYVLVVKNQAAFSFRYATFSGLIAGSFVGNLSNGGERILLIDALDSPIQDFTYSDSGRWPGRADGNGSSLVVVDTAGDRNDPRNWYSSREYGGSPGAEGIGRYTDVVVNELLANPGPGGIDAIELYNPTDEPISIAGWFLSDGNSNYQKYRIAESDPRAVLPAGGFVVFDETDFNAPGSPTAFALSASGEDVWLLEADATTGRLLRFADHVEFGATPTGVSLGRWPDGADSFGQLVAPTFPGPNQPPIVRDVVITEIMYNPSSFDPLEEYIELYNRETTAVNLAGWQIAGGVEFTIPNVPEAVLQPGGYLVVAADVAAFAAKYPGVTNVVGGWTGQLSNRGEQIDLLSPAGDRVDRVEYADEGDWAVRVAGPLDHGHYGWVWYTPADGGGKSIELVNMALSNNQGQNWLPSVPDGGTPGAVNSVASADIAPMILDVTHFPVIPRSDEPVTVTARLVDELTTGLTATLYWRVDGASPGAFTAVAMADDGQHGDGAAGDGVFGASIPAAPHGSVIEFFVSASDLGGRTRYWPSPYPAIAQPGLVDPYTTPLELPYLLYQVDDTFNAAAAWVPGSQPVYYLVMTERERAELADIGDGGSGEQDTDAMMNGTFVSVDGTGMALRYSVGIRNRGHGSRTGPPNNFHLEIPRDTPWHDVTSYNFNCRQTHVQILGSAVFRMAGVAAPEAAPVTLRVNGVDLAAAYPGSPMYGVYMGFESFNSQFADNHFPLDSNGNLYSVFRTDSTPREEGELRYEGPDPDAYRDTYFKESNQEVDDWSDLIRLTEVLNSDPDATYLDRVAEVMNIDQWLRFIALDTLIVNWETTLNTGVGDDYYMYRGVEDPRFVLIPHDLDSVFGKGGAPSNPTQGLFGIVDGEPSRGGTGIDGLKTLFEQPEVVRRYYEILLEIANTVFVPEVFNPLVDQAMGGFAPASEINAVKSYAALRRAAVLAQIPQEFTITSPLPVVSGYHYTTADTTTLSGTADTSRTASVLVGGLPATWNARTGQWLVEQTGGGTGGTVVSFQQGYNGYAGTQDTEIRFSNPNGDLSNADSINVDGSDSGGAVQALLRFDDLFGANQGQVSTTVTISKAELVLYVTNEGDLCHLYEMRNTWAENSNWNTFGGDGIQPDVETFPDSVASFDSSGINQKYTLDVTSSILAWQADPASNHGWAIIITGSNGMDIASSENGTVSYRPELRITLADAPPTGGLTLDPGINRVLVEAFDGPDGTGNLVQSGYIDVHYDPPAGEPLVIGGAVQGAAGAAAALEQSPEDRHLDLSVRDSYLPGTPFVVRAEILDSAGAVNREVWDATVTLSTDRPDIVLSTSQVKLYNGLGTALVTATGSGDFTLTAQLGDQVVSRTLVSLESASVTTVSGVLSGSTTWSGVIHVTSDLTVPDGATLTIEPGTLVLLNGVTSGTGGTDIIVAGAIQSLGTKLRPVTFTAYAAGTNWGEINHNAAEPSLYQYTDITRGGRSPAVGHSDSGPTIRASSQSDIVFDHVNITDLAGKAMHSTGGGNLVFRNVHIARAIMGPEIQPQSLLIEDTWITDMHAGNDADGIYIHDTASGNARMVRGVMAVFDDDAIDTLKADLIIEDYVIRDAKDKGLSVYDGDVSLNDSLVAGCGNESEDNTTSSVSAKANSNQTAIVRIDHSTIVATPIAGAIDVGIQARNKTNPENPTIYYYVTNSIIVATDPVQTDYPEQIANIQVSYTNTFGEDWTATGTGNINADPLFADPAAFDFRLRPGSPSIDAGDPASPLDPDGTRADQGRYLNGIGGTLLPQVIPGGTYTGTVILAPEFGPFRVTGNVTVAAGATMLILPGTTVFFEAGTSLTVEGRLLAEGTKYRQIRLTRLPGGGNWNGVQFSNSMEDNRITWAVLEYGVTNNGMVGLTNSNLVIDHATFDNTMRRRIRSENSSLIVRNSTFTDVVPPDVTPTNNLSEHIWGRDIPAGGHLIIENNVFGLTPGHNDAVDFDAGFRPDPVIQILGNTFLGGGDDALDLEGDAHIEGNVFMHYRKDAYHAAVDGGESNVLSAGSGHHYVVVRNTFYDSDHVALVKDGSYLTFTNNTVAGVTQGPYAALPGAIYFFLPGETTTPGVGAYVDGAIFADTPTVFNQLDAGGTTTDLVVHRSILPAAWHTYGLGNVDEDPRLRDPAGGDFRLRPGSPALGAGPGGLDMGALVPEGVVLSGEPLWRTASASATLWVGGPGITHFRYRLNDGSWSDETPATTPIALGALDDGTYTVYVIGRNSAAVWQPENEATVSKAWTVDTVSPRLLINEVLALNNSAVEHEGTFPDMIELVNRGAVAIDLGGMSLTDAPNQPRKFVFSPGTILGPGEFLVLYADESATTSGIHLGFALDGRGEGVWLYDAPAAGGALVDHVEFGVQAADLSIGRVGHYETWTLTQPTPGGENVALRTGDISTLTLNEWFAYGRFRLRDDFVELHNPDALPVSLGGLYLTDRPIGNPARHQIAALSFIAGDGFAYFVADGEPESGAGHVGFGLSPHGEWIGLYAPDLAEIDKIIYYSQTTDYSQGRTPDGQAAYAFFDLLTPGLPNPAETTTLVGGFGLYEAWFFHQTGADLGTAWYAVDYVPDADWNAGSGVFAREPDWTVGDPSHPVVNTNLWLTPPGGSSQVITYYFRKEFTLDVDPSVVPVSLLFGAWLDDGAAIYVNGREIGRVRISGTIGEAIPYDRLASNVGNASYEEFVFLPQQLLDGDGRPILVQGTNVIAVEVHQSGTTSSDVVFGLELAASTTTQQSAEYRNAINLQDGLRVAEIMYNPADDADLEFIELINAGAVVLELGGVRFTEGIDFTFPDMLLAPGQRVVVVRDIGKFYEFYGSGANVAGQFSGNLSNGGETLALSLPSPFDANILRFEYRDDWYPETDGGGWSLVVADPAQPLADFDRQAGWRAGADAGGSPGTADGEPLAPRVVVNEVLTHTDLPSLDAIELHNPTAEAVYVGGWYLTDSAGNYRKYSIEPGDPRAWIPAGGYVVFTENDFNSTEPHPTNVAFALDGARGESVWLVAADADGTITEFVDYVEFGPARNGESFGRWPNATGGLYPMAQTTLGQANDADGNGPRVGPIVISELHYNPGAAPGAGDLEFIEIYNPTAAAVELARWHDANGNGERDAGEVAPWRLRRGVDLDFPLDENLRGVVLPAGGVLLVLSFDPADTANASRLAAFHAAYPGIPQGVLLVGGYSGALSDAGDVVQLQRPDEPPLEEPDWFPPLLEDQVAYDDAAPWPVEAAGGGSSLQRVSPSAWGHDPASWTAAAPTPGTVSFVPPTPAEVVGRHVFYNNSWFDRKDSEANEWDDNAIATDKVALLPGQSATFVHYTSYAHGLNGVMIDVVGLPWTELLPGDFQFRVGNDSDPAGWALASSAPSVTVRRGAGVDGSDRVTLVWADGAIRAEWLEVTMLATANTGLVEPDVFYFGNAPGETGDSPTDANVAIEDVTRTRSNQTGFLVAAIDNAFDFNRDGRVNAQDVTLARANLSGLAPLLLIAPPELAPLAGASLILVSDAGGTVTVGWPTTDTDEESGADAIASPANDPVSTSANTSPLSAALAGQQAATFVPGARPWTRDHVRVLEAILSESGEELRVGRSVGASSVGQPEWRALWHDLAATLYGTDAPKRWKDAVRKERTPALDHVLAEQLW